MFAFLFARPARAKLSEEFLNSSEVLALRYGDVTEDFNPKTETNILRRQDADTIFSGIDRDKDGLIEKHEVLQGLDSPELQALIKESDDWTLQTAFQEKKLDVLFKNVDQGDGSIAREEWNAFVDRVILDRVEYLQRKALVETRNYYGKGLDGDRYLKLCGLVDKGYIARGWAEDYWYYISNTHALLGVFLCDPLHPLDFIERILLEVTCLGFTLAFTAAHNNGFEEEDVPFYIKPLLDEFNNDKEQLHLQYMPASISLLLMVTIPVILVRKVLYYILACPCTTAWRHRQRPSVKIATYSLNTLGKLVSLFVSIFGLTFFVLGFTASANLNKHFPFEFAYSQCSAWILSIILPLFLNFNPCYHTQGLKICGVVIAGNWGEERGRILHAIEKTGEAEKTGGLKASGAKDAYGSMDPHVKVYFSTNKKARYGENVWQSWNAPV